jgi:hypothetical protein
VHVAVALTTLVEHAFEHVPQLSTSVVVLVQPPLQRSGLDNGHPDAHAYELPDAAHVGVEPLHPLPQPPQLDAVVYGTQAPLHRL